MNLQSQPFIGPLWESILTVFMTESASETSLWTYLKEPVVEFIEMRRQSLHGLGSWTEEKNSKPAWHQHLALSASLLWTAMWPTESQASPSWWTTLNKPFLPYVSYIRYRVTRRKATNILLTTDYLGFNFLDMYFWQTENKTKSSETRSPSTGEKDKTHR